MSDILIKGMEMPKNCGVCPLRVDGLHTFQCMRLLGRAYTYELAEQRQEDCPLVALPDHGDLIDRNETIQGVLDKKFSTSRALIDSVLNVIKDAPTVLEANNE